MNTIKEILDLVPYSYTKVHENVYEFYDAKNNRIGVILDEHELDLTSVNGKVSRFLNVINVAFGVVGEHDQINNNSIDRKLTGAGDARKVFSTIGDILVNSSLIKNADCVIAGASDDAKGRRSNIYFFIYSELRSKLSQFKHADNLISPNGTQLLVARSCDLSEEEKTFILNALQLNKV